MVAFAREDRRMALTLIGLLAAISCGSVYVQLSVIVYGGNSNGWEANLPITTLPDQQLPFEIQRLKEVTYASLDIEKLESRDIEKQKRISERREEKDEIKRKKRRERLRKIEEANKRTGSSPLLADSQAQLDSLSTTAKVVERVRASPPPPPIKSSPILPIEYLPKAMSHTGKEACDKQLHSSEKLWIAVPAWDDVPGLHRALKSVVNQAETGYQKVRTVVFEDQSKRMFTREQKEYYSKRMDVTFLYNNETKKNLGSAYGKWKLFEYIRRHALPHEYTLVLDGDDTLADNLVLRDVHRGLQQHKPWFAWGRHNGKYSEQCHDLQLKDNETTASWVRPPNDWSFCHPRMFQSHLLQHLEEADFRRDDGTWLQKATDRPFIYQFMEMAGPKRVKYLGKRPMYNYTMGSHNGLKVFKADVIEGDKELVNKRPPAPQSLDTIHVVTCVYNRNNTREYLERLVRSELEPGQSLEIHVCNNKIDRQKELEGIVSTISDQRKLLQLSTEHDNKIHIYDMGGNHGGFSRFLLARRLMQTEVVDYIIMVDDDQYVTPSTVTEVYAKRQPRSFFTWYGKNWNPNEASYWRPREHLNIDPSLRYLDFPKVTTWHYGGTGMSIIDASVFLNVELYEIEKKFLFVEDVWLSYIVQVLGWHIGRLFVKFDDTGQTFRSATGQWTSLKDLKDEFFARVGFLACSKPRKLGKGKGKTK
jgi:hypothetical protein